MKLIFTGDINFRGLSNLTDEEVTEVFSEVKEYLNKADVRIVNLETPLGIQEKYASIYKSGPNLICEPENIRFLREMDVDIATLANNHIGDFGEKAVADTLDLLSANGIMYTGAGKDIDAAYKACRIQKDGITVSILSVCENEFGMATRNSYGSAGYNGRKLLKAIRTEKTNSEFVIVVFHGGNEFNPLPSPDTQERYRFICDMGADAVVATHTHCPQGYELYDKKPIIYSMGNFLFKSRTERSFDDSWYYGYMTWLDIEKEGISFHIIPYRFNTSATKISVFAGEDQQKMLKYIELLSEIIKNEKELEKYFCGWAYLHKWIPTAPADYSDLQGYSSAGNYNLICCEAHLSQAKKVFELCFYNRIDEAKVWSEKIKELTKMPV